MYQCHGQAAAGATDQSLYWNPFQGVHAVPSRRDAEILDRVIVAPTGDRQFAGRPASACQRYRPQALAKGVGYSCLLQDKVVIVPGIGPGLGVKLASGGRTRRRARESCWRPARP